MQVAQSLTTDTQIKGLLTQAKTIAVVGVSKNPTKASYFVARYMKHRGFRVIPVNPVYAGQELLGETVLGSLAEIDTRQTPVDIVDIFRRAEFVPDIVDEALEHLTPSLQCIWMQFGIFHEEAAAKARAHGVATIEDRCPKIEYQRLFGELRRAGINTGIISSQLPAR